MLRQFFVADAVNFNSHPTAHSDIWRPVKCLGGFPNQHLLNANRRGNGHRNVAIIVMVVCEHREDFLADEPRRLAVRNLLPGSRQSETDLPHPLNLICATRASRHSSASVNSFTSSASVDNLINRSNRSPSFTSSFTDASLSGVVIASTRSIPRLFLACSSTAAEASYA